MVCILYSASVLAVLAGASFSRGGCSRGAARPAGWWLVASPGPAPPSSRVHHATVTLRYITLRYRYTVLQSVTQCYRVSLLAKQ